MAKGTCTDLHRCRTRQRKCEHAARVQVRRTASKPVRLQKAQAVAHYAWHPPSEMTPQPRGNADDVSGKWGREKRLFGRGSQQTKAGPARMLAPSSHGRCL